MPTLGTTRRDIAGMDTNKYHLTHSALKAQLKNKDFYLDKLVSGLNHTETQSRGRTIKY